MANKAKQEAVKNAEMQMMQKQIQESIKMNAAYEEIKKILDGFSMRMIKSIGSQLIRDSEETTINYGTKKNEPETTTEKPKAA